MMMDLAQKSQQLVIPAGFSHSKRWFQAPLQSWRSQLLVRDLVGGSFEGEIAVIDNVNLR
jgi:hypothetical protein